ncbi:MAG: L-alanine exporter AlaE, partial [Desulfococcaceae bacterium]
PFRSTSSSPGPMACIGTGLFRVTNAEHRGRPVRILADIVAFSTFMLPQYAGVLWWVGAELPQILTACGTVVAMSLAVGRPYGLYMGFCRRILERVMGSERREKRKADAFPLK